MQFGGGRRRVELGLKPEPGAAGKAELAGRPCLSTRVGEGRREAGRAGRTVSAGLVWAAGRRRRKEKERERELG